GDGHDGRWDPWPAPLRRFDRYLYLHRPDATGEPLPSAERGHLLELHGGRVDALRPPRRCHLPRRAHSLRDWPRPREAIGPLRLDAPRRPGQGAGHQRAVAEDDRSLVREGRLRPEDRQAAGEDAEGPRPRLAGQGPLGAEGLTCRDAHDVVGEADEGIEA